EDGRVVDHDGGHRGPATRLGAVDLRLDRERAVVHHRRATEDDCREHDPLAAETGEPNLAPHGATPMAGFDLRTNSPTTIASTGTGFPSSTSRSYFVFSIDFVRKRSSWSVTSR